jgi:nitronate monooxygenase
MFKTRITEKLGIRYPIIQGALLWLSKAEMVAAVSNAGGLGILSSPTFRTKRELKQEIRKTKSLTDKPFAVQIVFLPAMRELPNEQFVEVILEEGVKVVETVGPSQASLVERLHKAGIMCIHKATTVRHALVAEKRGVDAVTVEGLECAGHPGMNDVTSLVLIQRAVEEVKIPVIAAGGFVDGKGLVAALALGAEGILMGTRFFVTKECSAHPNIKEWCLKAEETDTIMCLRSFRDPVRCIRTELAERVLGMEERGADLEELVAVVSGERNKQALESGNLKNGVISCGQCVGLIHDIPSIKELIDRIISEAVEVRHRLNAMQ